MDKNAIKKYAIWARNELISRVAQKADQYGITEAEIISASADSIYGRLLTPTEKEQRTALIDKINVEGYKQVIEEVAYTWFNRFTALRFMEVNGYLPSHVRVFTDDENRFAPQILAEAIHLDMRGLNMDKVFELKQANKTEDLYKYLLITQCNALNAILPGMFQKIEDYTELLLPDNLLREGSVIEQMITLIPEEDFKDIEIIGWMYQYYITEPHEKIVNPLHGKAYTKEEVPAATQIFTTDWVVKYIVDNSLGRYWIERNPESSLKDKLEYLVVPKSGSFELVKENVRPQDITVLDPCVGSGHFLAYAFEVLMMIYTECGWSERDAAKSIVENNLFGIDIDERAGQLAYFTVMMKARKYNRRALASEVAGVLPNIYAIHESNSISGFAVEDFCAGNAETIAEMDKLLHTMQDAREYGSILEFNDINFELLLEMCDASADRITLHSDEIKEAIIPLVKMAYLMSRKYDVVVTNPPYMNKYSPKLKEYINAHYAAYKGDLFSVFVYKCLEYCKEKGYTGAMTPMVWMFIKTYEDLREHIIKHHSVATLIQFEYSAFDAATVPICSFVIKSGNSNMDGSYFRLSEFRGGMDVQRQKTLEAIADRNCGYYYESDQSNFSQIPGSPIAYWVSKRVMFAFENGKMLSEISQPKQGMVTRDNNRFIRLWWEVALTNTEFNAHSHEESKRSDKKWYPITAGGSYRKWYGNNESVVNFQYDGEEIIAYSGSHIKNREFYFRESVSWSAISSAKLSMRYAPEGFLPEHAGNCFYTTSDNLAVLQGLCNSYVGMHMMSFLSPTLNFNVGDIACIPVLSFEADTKTHIIETVQNLRNDSKNDWDSFETSWDFVNHPIVKHVADLWDATGVAANIAYYYGKPIKASCPLELCYLLWQGECNEKFNKLKANEEELNRIFIDIYGLQDELTPEVEDKDVTVRKADLARDIRSFISYAVGCMFGRYSLNVDGIAYAGGEWNDSKYITFQADKDNVLPICDDEYFEDDIVGKFVKFVEAVYGKDTLEENLKFIADALGGKGSPRDVIRSYFLNDFYADHLKIYQKRPIYWQFDSGKKNGFKCLIYMHRYQPDTIARIRTDYVHEQQARYRTAIADLEQRIQVATTSERVKLTKHLQKLKDQENEIRLFEEKVHHLADQMICIDLDDGVKHNYEIFKDVLTKIK